MPKKHLILLAGVLALMGCASSGAKLRGGLRASDLVEAARKQIGAPYHFGGRSPSRGFDCSGLVWYSFHTLGVDLPHGTQALFKEGKKVPKGALLPGDLVFFDIGGDGVSHVGIYSGGDRMVHAPSTGGKVREEDISIKYWLNRFAGARRLD
jgi:cell wall-associated NlpC family hydrolase